MADRRGRTWDVQFLDSGDRMHVRVTEDDKGQPYEVDASLHVPQGTASTLLLEALCESMSVSLRKGIPISVFTKGLAGNNFAPNGRTSDALVPTCSSIVDYLAKSLQARYLEVSRG